MRTGLSMGSTVAMGLAVALLTGAFPAFAADSFLGEWATVTEVEGTEYPSDMKIWEEDGELMVSVEDDLNGNMETSNAKIDGNTLTFNILVEALSPDPLEVTMTLEDGKLNGTLSSELGDLPMSATSVGGSGGSIAGDWDIMVDVQGDEYPARVGIKEADGKVIVTIEDDLNGEMEVSDIEVDGGSVKFKVLVAALNPDPIPVSVMIDGDELEGTLDAGDLGEFGVTGKRAAAVLFSGLVGEWDVIADVAGDEYPVVMTIENNDGELSIRMEDDLNGEMGVDDPAFADNVLTFNITVDAISPDPLPVEVTFDGDTFEGVLDGGDIGEIPLTGTKAGGGDAASEIQASLQHFKDGMEKKDTEEIALALSDDFDHPEFGDKDTMISFLSDTFSGGDLDGTEIDFSGIEIDVDGDEATAYPAELMAAFGTLTIEFSLKKEDDGMWRVTTVEVEGL